MTAPAPGWDEEQKKRTREKKKIQDMRVTGNVGYCTPGWRLPISPVCVTVLCARSTMLEQ